MDAAAYQLAFDKGQLALLCANYDRRIDLLGAENKRLKAENAKLWLLAKGLYEFAYAEHPNAVKAGFADDLLELGVEVDG